jgi:hypothetical protein
LKLYGYTSDAGGIRHSLVDGSDPVTVDDARLMIVVCSAFANYLVARTSMGGSERIVRKAKMRLYRREPEPPCPLWIMHCSGVN